MIVSEDADGHLARTLRRLIPPGQRVLDLGMGSGRLPLLLAREAKHMVGLDLHWDMLKENVTQRELEIRDWGLVQGDMRELPFPSAWAGAVTAGWAIGHLRGWYPDDWQMQIGRVLKEMHRVVTPGGVLVIIETLSTGSLTPAPPTEGLAQYYAWLENEWGFIRETISTYYQFASVDEAIERSQFFFGAEMAEKIRVNGWARLPEWTGVWWRIANG